MLLRPYALSSFDTSVSSPLQTSVESLSHTMSTKHKYVQSSASTDKVTCDLCQELFTARGIRSHATHCARRQEKIRRREVFADAVDKAVEVQRKGESILSNIA